MQFVQLFVLTLNYEWLFREASIEVKIGFTKHLDLQLGNASGMILRVVSSETSRLVFPKGEYGEEIWAVPVPMRLNAQ